MLGIDTLEEVYQVDHEPSWTDPFIGYLTDEMLLIDLVEAQ